jgi:hypothetical protein
MNAAKQYESGKSGIKQTIEGKIESSSDLSTLGILKV